MYNVGVMQNMVFFMLVKLLLTCLLTYRWDEVGGWQSMRRELSAANTSRPAVDARMGLQQEAPVRQAGEGGKSSGQNTRNMNINNV